METPGKCSEWTRRRCKHCPPLYGAANVCAECVEEQCFEPRTLFITRVNCVIIMNAMTKKTLSQLKKEWLSEHPDATLEQAFDAGANWAINEFLKDLLHPADEEPNKGKFILMEMRNGDNYALYWVNDEYSWERICTMFTTTSWLYIDDLFPKKGGNHD